MILVEVKDMNPPIKRISARNLLIKMKHLKEKSRSERYCQTPCPYISGHQPRLPVVAPLNGVAKSHIHSLDIERDIKKYEGDIMVTSARQARD